MNATGTPHENPYAEHNMCSLGDAITAYANCQGNNWGCLLPAIAFAHCARIHTGIADSPLHATLGWDPCMPVHLATGTLTPQLSNDPTEIIMPVTDHFVAIHEALCA